MANAIASQVQALYVGYLGRAADQAGLNFWTNAITAGTSTLESVALGFTLSAEYESLYAGKTNEELAAAIYENVLGRAADADGLAFWVGEIENGTVTADTLLAAMLNSLGTVDQKVIDNKVFVANAYTAAAGADYTAEDGAKVIATVDGTDKSVSDALLTLPVSDATVHSAVVKLLDANEAVDANIDAWGSAHNDATPSSAEIYAALEAAEAKVATAAADTDLGITDAASLNTVETANFDTYNSADAAEALALSIARSQIATKKLALDGNLSTAVTDLEAVTTADKAGSLKALVDSYLAKVSAAGTAKTAETAAGVTLAGKAADADIVLDAAFDVGTTDYSFTVTAGATAGVAVFDGDAAEFGQYQATYDATTDKWTYAKYVTADSAYKSLSTTEAAVDVNLQKLLVNATAKSVLDATAAHAEAVAATKTAEKAAIAELAKIETVEAGLTDATDAASVAFTSALTGKALDYQNAVKALADHAAAKTAFEEEVSGVEAVRDDAATLAALEKVASDASIALGKLATVGDIGTDNGTAADDLFVFDGKTGGTINGFAGNDKIYFGSDFTLVTLTDSQVIADNLGNSSAMEIFFDASLNTLYVETEAFGGNSAGLNEIVQITLSGVTGVELSADGYLTVA